MKRPNWTNKNDACCKCSKLFPTPSNHEKPGQGELAVWQPNATDPAQWICESCLSEYEDQERRAG